jgi:hypothetical protein
MVSKHPFPLCPRNFPGIEPRMQQTLSSHSQYCRKVKQMPRMVPGNMLPFGWDLGYSKSLAYFLKIAPHASSDLTSASLHPSGTVRTLRHANRSSRNKQEIPENASSRPEQDMMPHENAEEI